MGFRQFAYQILSLQEQADGIRAGEFLCVAQQFIERGTGPGRHHVKHFGGQVFHPGVFNSHGQLQPRRRGLQESALLQRRLMQGDSDPVPQHFRQHQAGKPGPGTQIGQGAGFRRHQGCQLGAVPEMPPPQIVQRAVRHQIVAAVPIPEEIGVSLQPG